MSERTCTIEGCGGNHLARGWCGKHYMRWSRYGDPTVTHHPGRESGREVAADGYVKIRQPDCPFSDASGWINEHRYVTWSAGLLLDPSHHVHHINGIRDDNRLENLQVMTPADHYALHNDQNRKAHCVHGHALTPENTFVRRNGKHRECRTCMREQGRRRRAGRSAGSLKARAAGG